MTAQVSAVGALNSAPPGNGNNVLPITTHAQGNAVVMSVKISSGTNSTIGVVGGGCSSWSLIFRGVDTNASPHTHELWLGTVTTPGAYTNAYLGQITLTFAASASSQNVDISAQEFTAFNQNTQWSAVQVSSTVQAALVDNTSSSTTVTWPETLDITAPNQIYVGHARCPSESAGLYTAPAGSGFVVEVDGDENPFIYNTTTFTAANYPTLASGPVAITPVTVTASMSTTSYAVGAILQAVFLPSLQVIEPYGEGTYGAPRVYGYPYLTQYTVEPMQAASINYDTILVQWVQPQGAIQSYRLLTNRYGFPVDENDGNIIYSQSGYFGSQYADTNVIPGTYHYYGIYVQDTSGSWHRAGFAACLATNGYEYGNKLFYDLPDYFQAATAFTELTVSPAGDQYLMQFLNVIGWGFDYLKTQYDFELNNLNDPMTISIQDLYNLAQQMGMPFQAEVPASTMRYALQNWTHICQERGTPTGIENNISALSGYGVDLRIGRNLMLEQDQCAFTDPDPAAWSQYLAYNIGEYVSYGNYIYKCIASPDEGTTPTGLGTSNSVWQYVNDTDDPNATLFNPNTLGGVNTWEVIYPDNSNGAPTQSGAMINGIGAQSPITNTNFQQGTLHVYNKAGSAQPVYARSVSRIPNDIVVGQPGVVTPFAPDAQQPVLDGIPVPFTTSYDVWTPTLRYPTDSIVTWNGIPFIANRASTGAQPPNIGLPVNANYAFTGALAGTWTGNNGATLSLSTAQYYTAGQSCLMTPNGTLDPQIQSASVPVEANSLFAGTAWVYLATGFTCELFITWMDQFGHTISTSVGTPVAVSATTWTQLTCLGTAPITAVSATITVQVNGSPTSAQTMYADIVSLACWQTPEWTPLSKEARIHLMLSAYLLQNAGSDSPISTLAEFYTNHGAYNSRVGRVPGSGSGSGYLPASLTFDSFTVGPGMFLTGRNTDTDDQTWVQDNTSTTYGQFLIGNGTAYPASQSFTSPPNQKCIALVSETASGGNGIVAVTFETASTSAYVPGLVFRYQDDNDYWFATMTTLWLRSGGSYSAIGNYSTPFQAGDRMYVSLNGSTITVYRNGMPTPSGQVDSTNPSALTQQVLQVTNVTLDTATKFGIGVDQP